MIIGLGTGRCGTTSLAKWLNILHELTPYPEDLSHLEQVKHLCDKWNFTRGEVSLGYINIIEELVNHPDVTSIILLVRDREDFAHSLMNYHRGTHKWKELFPEQDFDTLEGIKRYWDWYNGRVLQFERYITVISPEQIPVIHNANVLG